jgi:hypothetical protein
MRKTFLITAILLLSAVWAVAQTSPSSSAPSTTPDTSSQQPTSPSSTSPSSTSPSQQPTTPDTSSTTQTTTTQTTQTSSGNNSIEGCLSGSAGNWTLTDQSGKTYQLSGDTSKLSDHVGHQIRVTGTDNSSSASSSGSMGTPPSSSSGATGAGSSSGSQPTFTVNKVKMISSTCSTTSK